MLTVDKHHEIRWHATGLCLSVGSAWSNNNHGIIQMVKIVHHGTDAEEELN